MTQTNALKVYLGIKEWLYFTEHRHENGVQLFELFKVDTVTNDIFQESDDHWFMVNLRSLFPPLWMQGLLKDYYGR